MHTQQMTATSLMLALGCLVVVHAAYVEDPTFGAAVAKVNTTAITAVDLHYYEDGTTEVFVAQHGKPGVLVFTETGTFKRSFGEDVLDTPHGMRANTTNGVHSLWVEDFGEQGKCVRQFEAKTGKLLSTIGTPGNGGASLEPLQFDHVADIAFTSDGGFVIADGDGGVNNRVIQLGPDRKLIRALGKNGTADSEFKIPHNVRVDSCGRFWVADRMNNRTQVFDLASGKFIGKWDHGDLQPYGLFIDGSELYIAANTVDHVVAQVGVYSLPNCDSIGTPQQKDVIPCDTGSNAHWIAVQKHTKTVYVAEVGGNKMKKFLLAK